MNKVILIGNLTSDPNMRTTASGKSVCTMRIAVNRMYKSSDGDTKTDYFDIVTWSKLANICDRRLRKGSKVSVIGISIHAPARGATAHLTKNHLQIC